MGQEHPAKESEQCCDWQGENKAVARPQEGGKGTHHRHPPEIGDFQTGTRRLQPVSVKPLIGGFLHQRPLRRSSAPCQQGILSQYPPDISKREHRVAAACRLTAEKVGDDPFDKGREALLCGDALHRKFTGAIIVEAIGSPWFAVQLHRVRRKERFKIRLPTETAPGEKRSQCRAAMLREQFQSRILLPIHAQFPDKIDPLGRLDCGNRGEMDNAGSVERGAHLWPRRIAERANLRIDLRLARPRIDGRNDEEHRLFGCRGIELHVQVARKGSDSRHPSGLASGRTEAGLREQCHEQFGNLLNRQIFPEAQMHPAAENQVGFHPLAVTVHPVGPESAGLRNDALVAHC